MSKLQSSHAFLGDVAMNNRAHNPEFWLAQRVMPTSLSTVSPPNYGFDQWRCQGSAGTVSIQRQTSPGLPNGSAARYMGYFEKSGTSGYMGACQFHEANDSIVLRGQQIKFGAWIKANNATLNGTTFRVSLVSWAGTADTITSAIVSSWAATPTFAANFTEFASGTATISNSGWVQVTCVGTVPSDCNNLVLFFHTTASVTSGSGNGFLATGVQLFTGFDLPGFLPRQRQAEVSLLQRYYEKSYSGDVAPGTSTVAGAGFGQSTVGGSNIPTGSVSRFAVAKRSTPSITIYSTTGASGNLRDLSTSSDVAATGTNIGTGSFDISGTFTVNHTLTWHWVAEAPL